MKLLFFKTVQFRKLALSILIFNFLFQFSGLCQIKIWPGGTTVVGSTLTSGSASKLHVVGNSTFSGSNTAPTSSAFIRGISTYSTATSPDYSWSGDDQTGFFHPTGSQTIGITIFGTEAMRINSSRNLLIGQTVNNVGNERLQVSNTASNGRALQLTTLNHTTDFAYCQINNVNRSLSKAFEVQLNGVPKYYIKGDGTTVFLSDRNLKTEINALENSIEKLMQLKCYSYKFIDEVANGNAQLKVGLLAQEAEEVIPNLVSTDDLGIKGIDYVSIIPYLIHSIQEQEGKINELKNQLERCCNVSQLKSNPNSQVKMENAMNINSENKSSYLEQNIPNPFNKESIIKAYISEESTNAYIMIFDLNGKMLKSYSIQSKGNVSFKFEAHEFLAGMYHYTLIVDNQEVDTKKMIITQ